MWESLGSERIWTHGLGGGRRRGVEDAGVDREWSPDVTSGRRRVPSNGYHSERPERLMHGTLRTHIIIFTDAPIPRTGPRYKWVVTNGALSRA